VKGSFSSRLAWMIPTLLGIVLCTFAAVELVPGDPAAAMLGPEAAGASTDTDGLAARRAALVRERGLDRPLPWQLAQWTGPFNLRDDGHAWFGGDGSRPWGGVLVGDLGREMHRPSVSVAGELARRLAVTVPLALAALVLSLAVALPLGILSAARAGSALDRLLSGAAFVLYAIPTFGGALMLILVFGATGLGWLPTLGLASADAEELGTWERALDVGRHALLPVVCLAYANLAYLSRQMRAGMLEALAMDSVRTARALGLGERRVVLRHALRNGLLPILTVVGDLMPFLVGGSVVVETVFDLPGVGRYAFEGLLRRDLYVILATTGAAAAMTLIGTLLADLCYAWVDPRIGLAGVAGRGGARRG
jgi:peptide/nickel transport system permease protein